MKILSSMYLWTRTSPLNVVSHPAPDSEIRTSFTLVKEGACWRYADTALSRDVVVIVSSIFHAMAIKKFGIMDFKTCVIEYCIGNSGVARILHWGGGWSPSFPLSLPSPFSSLPSPPSPFLPPFSPLPFPSLPLEVGPLNTARGSGGAL